MELVMFVGIPASGKSTQSVKYRQQGYRILSSDEIRENLISGADLEALTEKEKAQLHSRVFEIVRKEAMATLKQGQSVVVDATNLNRKRRMSFLSQFNRFSCTKKVCCLSLLRKSAWNETKKEQATPVFRMAGCKECSVILNAPITGKAGT